MSSCTVRERIGWRTQSDQVADAIQSDSGRNPQGVQLSQLHQQSQQNNLFKLSPLGFAACQSKNCTNKTNRAINQGVQLSQLHQQSKQSYHFTNRSLIHAQRGIMRHAATSNL